MAADGALVASAADEYNDSVGTDVVVRDGVEPTCGGEGVGEQ